MFKVRKATDGLAEFCTSYATQMVMTPLLGSHTRFGLLAMQVRDCSQTRIEFV
jgi:hypothetical protein